MDHPNDYQGTAQIEQVIQGTLWITRLSLRGGELAAVQGESSDGLDKSNMLPGHFSGTFMTTNTKLYTCMCGLIRQQRSQTFSLGKGACDEKGCYFVFLAQFNIFKLASWKLLTGSE